MLTVNVYIIVIYDVITVDYCKFILLYSPLNSYLCTLDIGYWTLNTYCYYYTFILPNIFIFKKAKRKKQHVCVPEYWYDVVRQSKRNQSSWMLSS